MEEEDEEGDVWNNSGRSSSDGSNKSIIRRVSTTITSVPLGVKFYLGLTRYGIVRRVCKSFASWIEVGEEDDNWDLCWTDTSISCERLGKMRRHQRINHFVGTIAVSRKNFLGRNLERLRKKFPAEFSFFPQTFLVPADKAGLQKYFKKHEGAVVITKPEAGSQGRGLSLVRRFEEINSLLLSPGAENRGNYDGSGGTAAERLVCQEYVSNPLLVDGLKFDFRIYVLLTGSNPLRVFLHEDGLVRFATEQYERPNGRNRHNMQMHLTNYSINKHSSAFTRAAENHQQDPSIGHKRSLKPFLELLASQGNDVESLIRAIDDLAVLTMASIQPSLSHSYSSCQSEDLEDCLCFEILGIDVLVDEKFKPWLLEVNHSPSFSADAPIDREIKFRVIREALQIVSFVQRKKKKKPIQSIKSRVDGKLLSLSESQRGASSSSANWKDGANNTNNRYRNNHHIERKAVRELLAHEAAEIRTAREDEVTASTGYRRAYPSEERRDLVKQVIDESRGDWERLTGVGSGCGKNNERKAIPTANEGRRSPPARKPSEPSLRRSQSSTRPSAITASYSLFREKKSTRHLSRRFSDKVVPVLKTGCSILKGHDAGMGSFLFQHCGNSGAAGLY